jgi:hypothetical protein
MEDTEERFEDWGGAVRGYLWPGGYIWPGNPYEWFLERATFLDYVEPILGFR